MRLKFLQKALFVAVLLCQFSICPAGERLSPNDPDRYLNAVREFADNVLKYGRDTYGPKHTPLFVDGINVNTHEPVKWIAPNGDRWILSNLASKQNLFRTLDGLTRITGDPKYKQAAMDAIKYAFENLRSPNGLLYWGETTAYDALGDTKCGAPPEYGHTLKSIYPHYELMWQVNPELTKQFVEDFWSAHILDWSNLDMNRSGDIERIHENSWDHKYVDGPPFFESKTNWSNSFLNAGADLFYAAAFLAESSGDDTPLIWGKRLAKRFVETRNPQVGISGYQFTQKAGGSDRAKAQFGKDFSGHLVLEGTLFPYGVKSLNIHPLPWVSYFLVSDFLGARGKEFRQWGLEELTAWGKVSYRSEDNSFIPMLIDGTSLEGYVYTKDGYFGSKGTVVKAIPAPLVLFWVYSVAYRATDDLFMWEMARNILKGNGLGDIGLTPKGVPQCKEFGGCSDVYVLLGLLELFQSTQNSVFIDMAQGVGDNVLNERFFKGFFPLSRQHIYARFDNIDSFALLHLHAALNKKSSLIPRVWPARSGFRNNYRSMGVGYDINLIYTLTDTLEPPMTLHEAVVLGKIIEIRKLLTNGADVNVKGEGGQTPLDIALSLGYKDIAGLLLDKGADINLTNNLGYVPLHQAVQRGQKDIVELLLGKGADINTTDNTGNTPLHRAVQRNQKDIAELLIDKGANIEVKNNNGQTPFDIAFRANRISIARILIAKGAEVSSIHIAAWLGDLARVKAFLEKGVDVNMKDREGRTALHIAASRGYKQVVELLLENGADINAGNNMDMTPSEVAMGQMAMNRSDIVELLISKGADVSPLHLAIFMKDEDKARRLIEAGADINKRTRYGTTPLQIAVDARLKNIVELLIEKGADVNAKTNEPWTPLLSAVEFGDKEMVELLIYRGADINVKDREGQPPLWFAKKQGHIEIVELLRKHGAKE